MDRVPVTEDFGYLAPRLVLLPQRAGELDLLLPETACRRGHTQTLLPHLAWLSPPGGVLLPGYRISPLNGEVPSRKIRLCLGGLNSLSARQLDTRPPNLLRSRLCRSHGPLDTCE